MTTQFLSNLSQDLTKLLESKKNYDFIINVDKDSDKTEFCAHSIILETRSTYFEGAISDGIARKENNTFILDFPDISVGVFNILIRYIYGGIIDLDNKEAEDILNLLIACEKLRLKELCDYLQEILTERHQSWLFQNFVLIQQISFKYSEFTKLQSYWMATVLEQPSEALFNTADFTSVGKEALLSLCKSEDLCIDEKELWDHLIRWGKAQNSELPEEITNWTPNDFNILKNTLNDFIPHIRFYEISSDDFYYKIMPYSAILPNDLYHDLLKYYLVTNWKPELNNLTPRKVRVSNVPRRGNFNSSNSSSYFDSRLIPYGQISLVSSWIQGSNDSKINKYKKVYYDFQLLVRGTRDGFTGEVFHQLCDNKGPTVILLRLKNEPLVFGGYNPLDWDANKNDEWEKAPDSFIFSLGREANQVILSRIQNEEDDAIYQSEKNGPCFRDLQFSDNFKSVSGIYFAKDANEPIVHESGWFSVKEYEVFRVKKRSFNNSSSK